MLNFFKDFGKREAIVYIVVILWIVAGIYGAIKGTDFTQLAAYFGSLTAYVATYIWAETKRPSKKSSILKKGPSSRRETMIYFVIVLWAIAGGFGIYYMTNMASLATYFVSLSGFIASWIAGEVYKPQDDVKKETSSDSPGFSEDDIV
jgi:preprotein translocase subunit SecE